MTTGTDTHFLATNRLLKMVHRMRGYFSADAVLHAALMQATLCRARAPMSDGNRRAFA